MLIQKSVKTTVRYSTRQCSGVDSASVWRVWRVRVWVVLCCLLADELRCACAVCVQCRIVFVLFAITAAALEHRRAVALR